MVSLESWTTVEVHLTIKVELRAYILCGRMFFDVRLKSVSACLNVLQADASILGEYGVVGIVDHHRGNLAIKV